MDSPLHRLAGRARQLAPLIAGLTVLQFVVYTYLFTNVLFTDHTFPNVWLYDYPSFKTRSEGRWMADLIILLQGGSGVQSFQMFAAAIIQAVNGVVLAILLGTKRRIDIAMIATGLCLYPAFVDYYSFAVDHLTFAIGDCFALAAFVILQHRTISWRLRLTASVLVMLSLACYPPKIALIGFLMLGCMLLDVSATAPLRPGIGCATLTRKLASTAFAVGLGALLYFVSTRITMSAVTGERAYLNSWQEILTASAGAFPATFRELLHPPPYLFWPLQWIPVSLVVAGSAAIVIRSAKRSWTCLLLATMLIALMPLMLHAAHIVNKNTWMHAGRIDAAYAYATMFFAGGLLGERHARKVTRGAVGTLCLGLAVTAMQQSNAAALKTIYDLNLMNRIVARAEPFLRSSQESARALVIAGREPEFPWGRYVRNEPRGIHLRHRTLSPYRQVATLNYLCGYKAFRNPTPEELRDAEASMSGKPIWPEQGSVYLIADTVVILLERPETSTARTPS